MEVKGNRYLNKHISFTWDGQVKGDYQDQTLWEILFAEKPVPQLPDIHRCGR